MVGRCTLSLDVGPGAAAPGPGRRNVLHPHSYVDDAADGTRARLNGGVAEPRSRRRLAEVMALVEVVDEAGLGRLPTHELARQGARRRAIEVQ